MRLTNDIRDAIVRTVLTNRFSEDVESLRDQWASFAVMTYDAVYDKSTQTKMKRLPKGWLPETDDITVQFGSHHSRLAFDPYMRGFNPISIKRPEKKTLKLVPYRDNMSRVIMQFEPDHELSLKRDELAAQSTTLKETIDSCRVNANQIVHSVTTMKKLLEIWPEVEPFAKPFIERPASASLPAVPVDTLNRKLGLVT